MKYSVGISNKAGGQRAVGSVTLIAIFSFSFNNLCCYWSMVVCTCASRILSLGDLYKR